VERRVFKKNAKERDVTCFKIISMHLIGRILGIADAMTEI
jgi:hypothetical protein